MVDPLTWVAGYAGKKTLDWILETISEKNLSKRLRQTVTKWATKLPKDISICRPDALFPDQQDAAMAGNPAVEAISRRLRKNRLPSVEQWVALISARRQFIRSTAQLKDLQPFFVADDEAVRDAIVALAEDINQQCQQDIKLFQGETLGKLDEISRSLDLGNITEKLDTIVRKLKRDSSNADLKRKIEELSAVLEQLHFFRKLASARSFRTKVKVMLAVSRLAEEVQKKWAVLLERALKEELDAVWIDELADYAIEGVLEKRILEEFSMSEEAFREYLEEIVHRGLLAAAKEADVSLEGLTTKDAERIQAEQAPLELFEQWQRTRGDQRALLLAKWVSEGRMRRLIFDCAGGESPGYFYMRKGRSLLLNGKRKRGFALVKAGIILDPAAAEGFALWLANPLVEESKELASDPEVLSFVSELYGNDKATLVQKMRASA